MCLIKKLFTNVYIKSRGVTTADREKHNSAAQCFITNKMATFLRSTNTGRRISKLIQLINIYALKIYRAYLK